MRFVGEVEPRASPIWERNELGRRLQCSNSFVNSEQLQFIESSRNKQLLFALNSTGRLRSMRPRCLLHIRNGNRQFKRSNAASLRCPLIEPLTHSLVCARRPQDQEHTNNLDGLLKKHTFCRDTMLVSLASLVTFASSTATKSSPGFRLVTRDTFGQNSSRSAGRVH